MENYGPVISSYGLSEIGLENAACAYWNLTTGQLVEATLQRHEGMLSKDGALVVTTDEHTGRSPTDNFKVRNLATEETVFWGKANVAFNQSKFDALLTRIQHHLENQDIYVQDCYCGADHRARLGIRVITETPWHNHFARNLFITPNDEILKHFAPDFTVLHVPSFKAQPERDGTRSDVFIITDFERRLVLIGGSSYAGEIKKAVFTLMNFLLPEQYILPMHCSANVGPSGDTAIFFGLSGTGKTTLSAEVSRTLVGDDEHGWGASGIFNFEDGCYAKVIKLDQKAEPEIYATTKNFGTILENVTIDPETRELDLDDDSVTENTRASYPLRQIPNASDTGRAEHPKNIIMLTADAFGVLPPISKLSPEQATYHFLSGYTAKVPGTERGVTEPTATFSTCFGGPFMPRPPWDYGALFLQLIRRHDTNCWLVNTGWTGGPYGIGQRMSIAQTRALLHGALDGHLSKVDYVIDPYFGFLVPTSCPGVPDEVLHPRNTWENKSAYDDTATKVAKRFEDNFQQYMDHVGHAIRSVAVKA